MHMIPLCLFRQLGGVLGRANETKLDAPLVKMLAWDRQAPVSFASAFQSPLTASRSRSAISR